MKQLMWSYLSGLRQAPAQVSSGIRIIPLISDELSSNGYCSLNRALSTENVAISEVNEAGAVPNVRVINDSERVILILDGEELLGGKQNRILNTSILVPPKCRLTIPVSCSEAGRWDYQSRLFSESEGVLSASMRRTKMPRVIENLKLNRGYEASQSEIWREISGLSSRLRVFSQTRALREVYLQRHSEIDLIARGFPCLNGQCGIYVEVNGAFAGLETVSSPEVWKDLHHKLIRSYAVDVLDVEFSPEPESEVAFAQVLEQILNADLIARNAVGLGEDIRLESEGICGSALFHREGFIHIAVFPDQGHHRQDIPVDLRDYLLNPDA